MQYIAWNSGQRVFGPGALMVEGEIAGVCRRAVGEVSIRDWRRLRPPRGRSRGQDLMGTTKGRRSKEKRLPLFDADSCLPAESERDWYVVEMAIVASENPVVARLAKELASPLRSDRESRTDVHSRLVHGVRRQDLCRWHRYVVEAEERVEGSERRDGWLREFLGSSIQPTATDDVHIGPPIRTDVEDRIERRRKDTHIAAGNADAVQRSAVHAELIELGVDHQPDVTVEVHASASASVPSRVKATACSTGRLRETSSNIEGESGCFLRQQGRRGHCKKAGHRSDRQPPVKNRLLRHILL